MKLYFATEGRLYKFNNEYYCSAGFGMALWNRYLKHFNTICIICRVCDVFNLSEIKSFEKISDPRLMIIELPNYVGLYGFIKSKKIIDSILKNIIVDDGAYICRLPGQIGGMVIDVLRQKKIKYGCEVVGNPWDVFSKGSISHPLRPIIQVLSFLQLKKQVYAADAVLYVTKKTLQKYFPARNEIFNIGISDVILKKNIIREMPRDLMHKDIYNIVSIGSLSQLYKGPDVAIEAVKKLEGKKIKCKLHWLGDGKYLLDMKKLAKKLDISDCIVFHGNVSSNEVHAILDSADVFVLASRTEGLPRALIEAMAHGLPCIGTKVGGIPELLTEDVLINKEDSSALADLLSIILCSPEKYHYLSKVNLASAKLYDEDNLNVNRDLFYQKLISIYN